MTEENRTFALEPLLTERDVARIINMSVSALRHWRLAHTGPPYLKIGTNVRYRANDLQTWLEAQPVGGGG